MSVQLMRSVLLKSKASKRPSFLNDIFKNMDKDNSRKIDYSEFKRGLSNLGFTDLKESEIRNIFNEFDINKDGKIDYREFVNIMKPSLAPQRKDIVDRAFQKLDINNDGHLTLEDFKVVYLEQARLHPKCVDGTWTVEQVFLDMLIIISKEIVFKIKFKNFKALRSFLDSFDTPGKGDGVVTKEEFQNFYSVISATIPDDAHFIYLIKTCYGIN
jgi:Ca2+-binding EF-hand superfamily protein